MYTNNDIASLYPNQINPVVSGFNQHKIKLAIESCGLKQIYSNNKTRVNLLRFLKAKYMYNNHKKLFPEEYV